MNRQNKELDIDNREEVIFIINSPYPNYAGGIENWLYNISSRISDQCRVTVVSINSDEYNQLYELRVDITYLRVNTISTYSFLRKFIRSYIALLDIIIANWMMKRTLLKHFGRSNQPLFVVCLDTMYCLNAGLSLKKLNKSSKIVSSARCPHAELYTNSFPLLKGYFFNLEKRMLGKVDEIWSNGEDTKVDLQNKGFESTVMLNGVDYDKFSYSHPIEKSCFNDLPAVINVATLLPIKGIKELLNAADHIINNLKMQVNFIFIGKGDSSYYIKYAKSKNIDQYVFFLGHKSNPYAYMKLGKVVTCLSGGSGLSMAAIESMAVGVPIVAWNSPVYRQFNQDGEYLKLVDQGDSVALGLAIAEVINNYDGYANIAQLAKDYARKFDWKKVAQLFLLKLFNNV